MRLAIHDAGILDDLVVDVGFHFTDGLFRYATDDDFVLDPARRHWGLGLLAPALGTGATVAEPGVLALCVFALAAIAASRPRKERQSSCAGCSSTAEPA